jgi:hypothetical protein
MLLSDCVTQEVAMTVRAIETRYADTLFRSRLEARWAAFFDALCWPWTYEPPIGRGYLPDFVISGAAPLVVEVKPAVVQQDYFNAVSKVRDGLENRWEHQTLIVGLSPVATSLQNCCCLHPAVGLLGRGGSFAPASWYRCPVCTAIAVARPGAQFTGTPCGHAADGSEVGGPALRAVEALWAQATNRVRWTPYR